MKNNKDHLPIYGPGPIFGGVVIALTVAAMLCRNLPVFQCGNIAALRIPLIVIGIILILFAVFLWVYAVIITKIDDWILHNHLVTTGRLCAGTQSDLLSDSDPMHRGADDRRECAVPDLAAPLPGVSDCSVEEYGRKVAQRALRRRVQGVLQKGEPLYPVVPEKVKEDMNV